MAVLRVCQSYEFVKYQVGNIGKNFVTIICIKGMKHSVIGTCIYDIAGMGCCLFSVHGPCMDNISQYAGLDNNLPFINPDFITGPERGRGFIGPVSLHIVHYRFGSDIVTSVPEQSFLSVGQFVKVCIRLEKDAVFCFVIGKYLSAFPIRGSQLFIGGPAVITETETSCSLIQPVSLQVSFPGNCLIARHIQVSV